MASAQDVEMDAAGEDGENQDDDMTGVSVGIVTSFKVIKAPKPSLALDDETSQLEDEVLLFMSLLVGSKPSKTTAWVSLREHKVYANVSLGFVSQRWLEKFQPHHSGSVRGQGMPAASKLR